MLAPSLSYEKVITNLISEYSRRGDVVYDPLAGYGIHMHCAKKLGRDHVGVDIDEKFVNKKLNIQHGDSSKTRFPDGAFDFCITSFNYFGMPTSDSPRAAANLKDFNQYKKMVNNIVSETYRVLSPGAYFVNITAVDYIENGILLDKIFCNYFDRVGFKRVKSKDDMLVTKMPKELYVMLYRKLK